MRDTSRAKFARKHEGSLIGLVADRLAGPHSNATRAPHDIVLGRVLATYLATALHRKLWVNQELSACLFSIVACYDVGL